MVKGLARCGLTARAMSRVGQDKSVDAGPSRKSEGGYSPMTGRILTIGRAGIPPPTVSVHWLSDGFDRGYLKTQIPACFSNISPIMHEPPSSFWPGDSSVIGQFRATRRLSFE